MKINEITSCCDECTDRVVESGLLMFKGYECTKDCSGHKAGYKYASFRMQGKTQADMQRVMSGIGTAHNSFWEGAKAYLEGR